MKQRGLIPEHWVVIKEYRGIEIANKNCNVRAIDTRRVKGEITKTKTTKL